MEQLATNNWTGLHLVSVSYLISVSYPDPLRLGMGLASTELTARFP